MNKSTIFDRILFKIQFKDIYNDKNNKFTFSLNDGMLTNIITNWKQTSKIFTNGSVLDNKVDYKNNLILREFKSIYIQTKKKISG